MRTLISARIIGIMILIMCASGLITTLAYYWFSRSKVEVSLANKKRITILITLQKKLGNPNELILIAQIEPQTSTFGIIALYPATIITKESGQLAKMPPEDIRKILNAKFPFKIGYGVHLIYEDIERAVDLMEGIPVFFWENNLLKKENFPKGEFLLDGSQVINYLDIAHKTENLPAFRLFRHYSLIINTWLNRESRWKSIQPDSIFNNLTSKVDTDLSFDDMITLASKLVQPNWKIFTMEIPVTRVNDNFLLDTEATALYLKDFERKITDEQNLKLDRPPKLEVRNGTNIPNLAKKYRSRLTKERIAVLEFSNADRHDYKHTILLNTSGSIAYTDAVSKILGIKRVYAAIDKARFTDLILILGKDHKDL